MSREPLIEFRREGIAVSGALIAYVISMAAVALMSLAASGIMYGRIRWSIVISGVIGGTVGWLIGGRKDAPR